MPGVITEPSLSLYEGKTSLLKVIEFLKKKENQTIIITGSVNQRFFFVNIENQNLTMQLSYVGDRVQ